MMRRLRAALDGRLPGVLLLALVVWLGATAGLRTLTLPDEGRYVGVALEMLRSGEWLTPTIDGLPYFHKPPLFYWVTAAGLSGLGVNAWAARLAPLLGAVLAAWSLYLFVRRWSGQHAAKASLIVLATQPFFYIGAQFANLDMLVAGCISATVLLLAHASQLLERGLPWRRALLAAYAMAGLGMLAKGLIGIVLPALVIVVWLLASRRWRLLWPLISVPGMALLLLVAAPWFLVMQTRFEAFADYFFVVQHFKRFSQAGFNNMRPVWFYLAVLPLLCLPWPLWLALARRGPRADAAAASPAAPAPPLRSLMWSWLAVIVLFFSMPRSKLVGYVLPALPPLAWLIAEVVRSARARSPGATRWWHATVGVSALLCVGVAVGLAIFHPATTREAARVMGAARAAGEPVYFVGEYFFDAPFYGALRPPYVVVDHWDDPDLTRADNWRKELVDAGRFDAAAAATTFMTPAQLPAALCAHPRSWVYARSASLADLPLLAAATPLSRNEHTALYRIEPAEPAMAATLNCPEKPNADSTGK